MNWMNSKRSTIKKSWCTRKKFGMSYKGKCVSLFAPPWTSLTGLPRKRMSTSIFDILFPSVAHGSHSSDPVIEPMLQAVPDPFDSYGPPPAEDKIFSILPPLSVMANVPSSSPSPITSTTTELEGSSDGMVSGQSSWTPNPGGFFESSSAWADSPIPSTATPPRSVSPPIKTSPPVSPPFKVARRNSHPPGSITTHVPRKSESKLRSVLAAIDETTLKQNGEFDEGSSSTTLRKSVSDSAVPTYGPTPINGTLLTGPPEQEPWSMLNYNFAEAPDIPREDDITPQNTIRRPPSPFSSPPTDTTPHVERSYSPHSSDETTETAQLPS